MNKLFLQEMVLEFNETSEIEFPVEFIDLLDGLLFGARKYAPNDWLRKETPGLNKRDNHGSISRHAAETYMGKLIDEESGVAPEILGALRLLMAYTRRTRGIE